MTIREVVNQLYDLSTTKIFSGEKITKFQLERYVANSFRSGNLTHLATEIDLRDGRWTCIINRYASRPDGYDYTIPDDREHETKIKALLGLA